MAVGGGRLFFQPCDEEDAVAAQVAGFRQGGGSEGTDEYTPLGADNASIQQHLPLVRVLRAAQDDTADSTTGITRSGVLETLAVSRHGRGQTTKRGALGGARRNPGDGLCGVAFDGLSFMASDGRWQTGARPPGTGGWIDGSAGGGGESYD